eukprot:133647-Pyramimonas_sp.AAC.1
MSPAACGCSWYVLFALRARERQLKECDQESSPRRARPRKALSSQAWSAGHQASGIVTLRLPPSPPSLLLLVRGARGR